MNRYLVLAGGLAAVAATAMLGPYPSWSQQPNDRSVLTMTAAKESGYTLDGRRNELSADKAIQNGRSVTLVQPRMTFDTSSDSSGALTLKLRAEGGILEAAQRVLTLRGAVVLTLAGDRDFRMSEAVVNL